MSVTTRKVELIRRAELHGLYVATWTPGDGHIRYRFFTRKAEFADSGSLSTAEGIFEAETWLDGFISGLDIQTKNNSIWGDQK